MRRRKPINYGGYAPSSYADDAYLTAIGQTTVVLRVDGDNALGIIYAAVRPGTKYALTDQALVRDGTGAHWFDNLENAYQRSFVIQGLTPGTVYWYGTYRDTGSETSVLSRTFTTADELPEPTEGKAQPIGD
jgi:hypothetical protein